jgi:glycosyltransferase involved in cell wall biosynthesis
MAIAEARRSGRRVVCSIGTVGDRKNQRLLVETLASISETLRPLVVLVGEGDIAGITALAQARGVGALVRCTGYRSDARDILRAADCLVLPSRSEGLPLALLEAFCDRVPVVASDIPEFREVVADGVNGLLFAEGDVSALGAALERMFTMTAAQRHDLVGRAHEVQVERFRTSQMADAYMREYAGLLIPTRRDAGSSCAA